MAEKWRSLRCSEEEQLVTLHEPADAQNAADPVSLVLGEDFPELREGTRRICAGFPGSYWRELDDTRGYPSEFVRALTNAGYLAALIPEEYDGSGLPLRAAAVILEEINASGCTASAAHAQMYIM
ncbi:MAG: acyl-CoA dehydrogenase family protein, partial [Mesorhizobium sp.]